MSLMLLLLVMPVCSICPGFFLLRRLQWSKDEKLAGSIGLSVIIIYVAATAIYLTGVDWRWCWLVSALCLLLGLAVREDLVAFLCKGQVRRQLVGFTLLLVLGLVLDALIQHYSGGRWPADWVAHYQRSLFFLQRQPPLGPNIVQPDLLPSRPPMMNLLATFFLAQFGNGFDRFQLVFLFLNLLVFFPCVLVAGLLVKFGNRNVTLIISFLCLSPTVLQNATWTWTKLLTVFYVILSIALYVRGWRKNDPQRIVAAAISMSAAMLVHYSAGPFAVALALHYLLIVRARRRPLAEVAGSICLAGALLAPWFIWSVAVFGASVTFGSNSTIADSNQLSLLENIAKIGQNLLVTLIPRPFPWWTDAFRAEFFQPNLLGSLRDGFFLIYQSNLPFTWGLLGWAGVLVLMRRSLLGQNVDRSIARFWSMLALIAIVLGIAVYGEADSYGVAHICLQPLTLMGSCLLAAGFHLLPRWLRCAMAVAMLVDALLGIVLHFRLEMMSFQIVELAPAWDAVPLTNSLLSQFAIQNSASRFVFGLHFLGDQFVVARWVCFGFFIALLGFALCTVAKTAISPRGGRPLAITIVVPFIVGAITCTVIHPTVDLFSANSSSPAQASYQAGMDAYRAKRFSTFLTEMGEAYLLDPSDARTRYVLRVAPTAQPRGDEPMTTTESDSAARRLQWRLFVLSFTALFLELLIIRWSPSVVRLLAYYANLMLISSFLGLGIGAMLARKRRLFALFPILLAMEIGLLFLCRQRLLPTSSAEERFYSGGSRVEAYIVLIALFASNALTFVSLGQAIGEIFNRISPLRAYCWDLAGSLAGTIAFGVVSFTHFSPLLGIGAVTLLMTALTPPKRWGWTIPLFLAALGIMAVSNEPNTIWSPYHSILIRPRVAGDRKPEPVSQPPADLRTRENPPIFRAEINQHFYQYHGTIDLRRYAEGSLAWEQARDLRMQYFAPYLISVRHDRVLVLGSGGGMDVEAALLNGAAHVDAVEIDPRLVSLARQFNASGVYDDPRVSIHVNDARAFLRSASGRYDMVVFGYLDSQALFSYMSNVRIDGFIYTVQSLQRAWELVDEGGTLALSFAVEQPWLARKLVGMVTQATQQEPLCYVGKDGQIILAVSRGPHRELPESYGQIKPLQSQKFEDSSALPLATDDWPYLYLSQRTVPTDYLIVIALLLGASIAALLKIRGRNFGAGDWHFLFLGWGFLLLETKSIDDCSLYFGTTWLVTTIVIIGVLLMVLLANLATMRFAGFSPMTVYLPLLASLVGLYLVPRDWVLALPFGLRLAWALLIVPLPIFFAGLIFSATLQNSADPAASFGANLIGAMIGGFCEYLGMAIGHHALMLVVIAAYLASFACLNTVRRTVTT